MNLSPFERWTFLNFLFYDGSATKKSVREFNQLFQNFSLYSFRYITKSKFIEKLLEIFPVWIDFMLARFGWFLWKFDKFKFRNIQICWFLFKNYDSHMIHNFKDHKTGSGLESLEISTIHIFFLILSLRFLVII